MGLSMNSRQTFKVVLNRHGFNHLTCTHHPLLSLAYCAAFSHVWSRLTELRAIYKGRFRTDLSSNPLYLNQRWIHYDLYGLYDMIILYGSYLEVYGRICSRNWFVSIIERTIYAIKVKAWKPEIKNFIKWLPNILKSICLLFWYSLKKDFHMRQKLFFLLYSL